MPFVLKPSLPGRSGRPGEKTFLRRPESLLQQRPKPGNDRLPVLILAARLAGHQVQHAVLVNDTAEPGKHPLALNLVQAGGATDVKQQFNPGLGAVGVLPAGPTAARKAECELTEGNAQTRIDWNCFVVGHSGNTLPRQQAHRAGCRAAH